MKTHRKGEFYIFRNRAHYPSLDGQPCRIVSIYPPDDFASAYRYGVQFSNGFRMAAQGHELR